MLLVGWLSKPTNYLSDKSSRIFRVFSYAP